MKTLTLLFTLLISCHFFEIRILNLANASAEINFRTIVDSVFVMQNGSRYAVGALHPLSKLKKLLDENPEISTQVFSEGLYALTHWKFAPIWNGCGAFELLVSKGARQLPAINLDGTNERFPESNLTAYIQMIPSTHFRLRDDTAIDADEYLLKCIQVLAGTAGSSVDQEVIDFLIKTSMKQYVGHDYYLRSKVLKPEFIKIKSLDYALSKAKTGNVNPFKTLLSQESYFHTISEKMHEILLKYGHSPVDAQAELDSAFLRSADYGNELDKYFLRLGADINAGNTSRRRYNALMIVLSNYRFSVAYGQTISPEALVYYFDKIKFYVENDINVNYSIAYNMSTYVSYLGVFTLAEGTPFESYLRDHGMIFLPRIVTLPK